MHLPFPLSDSETECPADHRSLATGIAPVRSSGIETCSTEDRASVVVTELVPPLRQTFAGPRRLAVSVPAAIAVQESAPSDESPRLLWFSVENLQLRYS